MVGSIRSLRSARSRASVRSSSEPAEADYIRRQNCGKFPSLGHKVPSPKSLRDDEFPAAKRMNRITPQSAGL